MFCRSLFVLLSFFLLATALSVQFDLRLLIAPFDQSLVSSNFSYSLCTQGETYSICSGDRASLVTEEITSRCLLRRWDLAVSKPGHLLMCMIFLVLPTTSFCRSYCNTHVLYNVKERVDVVLCINIPYIVNIILFLVTMGSVSRCNLNI